MASSTPLTTQPLEAMLHVLPETTKQELLLQHYGQVKAAYTCQLKSRIATNRAELEALDKIVPSIQQNTSEDSTSTKQVANTGDLKPAAATTVPPTPPMGTEKNGGSGQES
jgi:hypothetical protein